MARHVFDQTSLECPDDLLITTVLACRVEKNEFAPNLVITRDRLRPNESDGTYIGRQLVELAKGLKRFKLHARDDVSVAGRPAHRVSCGWQGTQGPVEQRITIVIQGGRALTYTVTVPKAKADALFPTFDTILASMVIDDPPEAPVEPSTPE